MQWLISSTISFFISLIQNMQGTYVRTWIDIPEKDRIKYSSMWDCILLKISNSVQIYLDVRSVWKLTTLSYNWISFFRNANCFVIVKINWGPLHGKSLGDYFYVCITNLEKRPKNQIVFKNFLIIHMSKSLQKQCDIFYVILTTSAMLKPTFFMT